MSNLGIYQGSVLNNDDPEQRGRVICLVPQVLGDSQSGWCEPIYPTVYTPQVNDIVWIHFVNGDLTRPIYFSSEAVTAAKIMAGAITADKIDAKAVTADKIDTDAVTADKIDAEAVTADKIATDSIETKHLRVTSENWAMNPGFENDSGALLTPHVIASGCTDGGSSTTHHSGSYSRLITLPTTSAANVLYINGNPTVVSAQPKVRVGETWKFIFYAQAVTGTPTIQARLQIRDRVGTTVVTSASGVATATSGSWTKYEVTHTVTHADSYYVFAYIQCTSATAGNQFRIDSLELRNMTTSDLIVDGAIDGKTITGATITGGVVQTSVGGNRVSITEVPSFPSAWGELQFFSGDASEGANQHGKVMTAISGSGGPRHSYMTLNPPGFDTGTSVLDLWSGSVDGNTEPHVYLSAGAGHIELSGGGGVVINTLSRALKGIDFGTFNTNSDENGLITVPHSIGSTPVAILLTPRLMSNARVFSETARTATTFTFRVRDDTGALVASTTVQGSWLALA